MQRKAPLGVKGRDMVKRGRSPFSRRRALGKFPMTLAWCVSQPSSEVGHWGFLLRREVSCSVSEGLRSSR